MNGVRILRLHSIPVAVPEPSQMHPTLPFPAKAKEEVLASYMT
jgi:hypothetical protein